MGRDAPPAGVLSRLVVPEPGPFGLVHRHTECSGVHRAHLLGTSTACTCGLNWVAQRAIHGKKVEASHQPAFQAHLSSEGADRHATVVL